MSGRGFLERTWEVQHRLEKRLSAIGKGRYARVLRMARKPEPDKYRQTLGIVLAGITLIGGIGFAIFLFMTWFLRLIGAD